MRIKDKLQHIIRNSLIEIDVKKRLNEIILEPSKESNYDYYTNIAITLAKDLHKKPEEIADTLKNLINDELIERIDVIYPGTLNVLLNKRYIINGISEIIEKNINYGKTDIGEQRKINIDFINNDFSQNITIESIFNAIYGDNLSRILKYNGFDITKEYYVNDTSKELEYLVENAIKRYEDICKQNNNFGESNLEKQSIRDTAFDIYSLYRDTKLNEKPEYFKKEEISTILDNKKYYLDKYRINFDTYTSEQDLYDKGLVDFILDKLNRSGYTYFYEDELWLKTTDFNDKKDRILIKSDGEYTCILPLIAYHMDRINRKYDGLINIYNNENIEYKQIIKPILKMLEQDTNKLEIKVFPEIKISEDIKRLISDNNNINITEINSIRYLFAKQNIEGEISLELSQKSSLNDIENINITIQRILSSYNKKITKVNKFSTIDNQMAYIMLNKLYDFEEIVIFSGLKQKPHLICNYLEDLVRVFNDYYKSEQIITEDEIYTNERLNLLLAVKIVINNALDLIGIIPREN